MGAPWFYLREDERVLARVKPTPSYALALLAPIAGVLAVLLAVLLAARALLPGFPEVALASILAMWGALLLIAAFVIWRRVVTSEVALTDQRIYTRVGRLVTRVHFTTHDKITDIHYRQGPLERALGAANLTFSTAGGDVAVWGIRDAVALKQQAEVAREAFIRVLLAESSYVDRPPRAAAAPGAAFPAGEERRAEFAVVPPIPEWTGPRPDYLQAGETPVWYARPRPVAAVASLQSLLGIAVILVFSPFMEGPRRVWVPVAALGLAFILVAARLMQLRRTEYVSTDRRVYARRGLFGTTVNQLTYDKITDITLHQDILGRVFGYASVTVQTAGSNQAPITMVGLADALATKSTIEQWRDRSLAEGRR